MTDAAPSAAPTLLTAWKAAQARLKQGAVDSPAIDARLLLEAAAGATRTDILTDPYRAIGADQLAAYDAMIERRLRREPVSRILGRKGFWKIMLNVTPDVLSPRPDTETIMDVALAAFPQGEAFQMIDLGTGSGAILLAAEFITRERLCCPFYTFTLELEPAGGALWLRLTGAEGAKAVLQAGLDELLAAWRATLT